MNTVKVIRLIVAVPILVFLVIVLALIAAGRIAFYEVPTSSMEPTLNPGDRVISLRHGSYDRGDIVVFQDVDNPEEYLVKRVVALPGDRISVAGGRLYVNSEAVKEPYIAESMEYSLNGHVVGADRLFVLGDNRNESDDSHRWGRGIDVATVMGKVHYIYAPGSRRGFVGP